MTFTTHESSEDCIEQCKSEKKKFASYNSGGGGVGSKTCQCFDGCKSIGQSGVYNIYSVDASVETCTFCPDDPCTLGGGNGEDPLIDPWCMPCVPEKIWDFDSWCFKEWDYWCVGHFVEMCQEETGITCPDGSKEIAKEIQLQFQATGRAADPDRPIPGPYPSPGEGKNRIGGIP
jgi:hypothetical protein